MHRSPKNRIARNLTRILNRLEVEYRFTLYPLYVATLNNELCDKLPRIDTKEAHEYAAVKGLKYVDISESPKWYMRERMRSLSLVLPPDHPDRVRSIMQQVEKRAVRIIGRGILPRLRDHVCGRGVGNWGNRRITKWPSETVQEENDPQCVPGDDMCPAWTIVLFSHPHIRTDVEFLTKSLKRLRPHLILYAARPKQHTTLPGASYLNDYNTWSWLINAANMGAPVSCIRRLHVAVQKTVPVPANIAPLYLFDIDLPIAISDYLQITDATHVLPGTVKITKADYPDVNEPTQLEWIHKHPLLYRGGESEHPERHGGGQSTASSIMAESVLRR